MDAIEARDLGLLVKRELGLALPAVLAAIMSDHEDSFVVCLRCKEDARIDEYYESVSEHCVLRDKYPDDEIVHGGNNRVFSLCDTCKERIYAFICCCMSYLAGVNFFIFLDCENEGYQPYGLRTFCECDLDYFPRKKHFCTQCVSEDITFCPSCETYDFFYFFY